MNIFDIMGPVMVGPDSPQGRPCGGPFDLTSSGELNSPCGKVSAARKRLDAAAAAALRA